MTKQILLGAASLFVVGVLTVPASADVFVFADLFKDKDIFITERIFKTKDVVITVDASIRADGAAEAEAVVNALNEGNSVGPVEGVTDNFGIELDAEITDSINGNQGIVGVNQDAGNFANQGNVVSFAFTGAGVDDDDPLTPEGTSFTNAQAWVEQDNLRNSVVQREEFTPDDPNKTALISGSVNGNTGVTGVNQNAGNFNNQHNALALAVGVEAVVALSEAALGQDNTDNHVEDFQTVRTGDILDSVNGNNGITAVNQSTGNFNNQASVVAFSALTSSVNIGSQGAGNTAPNP